MGVLSPDGVFLSTNRETKGKRRPPQWVIIGRFGNKFDLVHFRGSYLEVDLDEMRSENRLLDLGGRDVELQLHLRIAKSPIHYLAVSQALFFVKNGKWNFGP